MRRPNYDALSDTDLLYIEDMAIHDEIMLMPDQPEFGVRADLETREGLIERIETQLGWLEERDKEIPGWEGMLENFGA